MLNIVLEVGWGYGQRGSARTCEVKQVKNRIRGRGRIKRVRVRGRAIPRARVQSQGKGHKEGQGKKSRFKSQK